MTTVALVLAHVVMAQTPGPTMDCTNVAFGKPTEYNKANSMYQTDNADGINDGLSSSWPQRIHLSGNNAWVYIDLEEEYRINRVTLLGNGDHAGEQAGMEIVVTNTVPNTVDSYADAPLCATVPSGGIGGGGSINEYFCSEPLSGRYVGFYLPSNTMSFSEAEVFTTKCCVDGASCGPTSEPTTAVPTSPTLVPTTAMPTMAPTTGLYSTSLFGVHFVTIMTMM